jgi:N-acetylmuramic acid 6-phosphate (MurNAc-6-P) etherase
MPKKKLKAVSDKRRHDDVLAILNNDNTPLVIAGIASAVLIPVFSEEIADKLGAPIEDVKEAVTQAVSTGTVAGRIAKLGAGVAGKVDQNIVDKIIKTLRVV